MAAVTNEHSGGPFSAGGFTPTKPTNTVNGDLLLLQIGFEKGTDVSVTATQWTLVDRSNNAANVGQAIYRRIEDGATLNAISLSNGPKGEWTVVRITGHDGTTPINNSAGANGGSSQNPDPPSVTPAGGVTDCLALALCGNKKAGTGTEPSGYTERWDRANTGDGIGWTYGASKQLASASAENPAAVTASDNSGEWAAATVLIAPAASGGLTISPGLLGGAVAVAPAKLNRDMDPGALGAAAVVAPTQLRLEVEPALLGGASVLGPDVVPGSVIVQPGLLGVAGVLAPGLAIEIEPSVLGGALVTAIAQLLQEIADPAPLGAATALAPELSQPAGPQTVEPAVLGGAAGVTPTLLPGGVVIVLGDLGDAAAVAPALTVGGVTIVVEDLGASAPITPAILRGGVQILPSVLGGATVPAPLLTAGGLLVQPAPLGVGAALAPALQAGAVVIELDSLGMAAVPAPALEAGMVVIVIDALGTASLVAPVLAQRLAPPQLGGASQVQPSMRLAIVLDALGVAALIAPMLDTGSASGGIAPAASGVHYVLVGLVRHVRPAGQATHTKPEH